MRDDVGQQGLQAAEQRLAPTGGQHAPAPRVEVGQEGQDEELTADPNSADMSRRCAVEVARSKGRSSR